MSPLRTKREAGLDIKNDTTRRNSIKPSPNVGKRALIKPIEIENKDSNIDEIIMQHFDNSMLFRA